jgi:hypothetical protein
LIQRAFLRHNPDPRSSRPAVNGPPGRRDNWSISGEINRPDAAMTRKRMVMVTPDHDGRLEKLGFLWRYGQATTANAQ